MVNIQVTEPTRLKTGLVSVSFRSLSPREVIACAENAGLDHIEWGSDIHVPCGDRNRLNRIAALQWEHGIACCSYGTYFRLGVTPLKELERYIDAAEILETDILRVWCGDKGSEEYTPKEHDRLFADCIRAAEITRRRGVTLCLECHNWTYTDRRESAMELMQTVSSPAFQMYWQPNQFRTAEENADYARALAGYTRHLHVFHWQGEEKFPLRGGMDDWLRYLSAFSGDHVLLLEFMPEDRPESLPREADTLRELILQFEQQKGGSL